MGEKHNVRFEPVGIEFEVDEDETVLNAAFRQGLMLMHGCKEGQCSACKSFLLDGEVDLERYSTFALPDFEEEEGWTLLCRAHALTDLEVELINYDEEMLHGGLPLQTAKTRVAAVEELTHDIRRLVLTLTEPEELEFHPGQYVDITIPGDEDEHRSFSMANLPSDTGRARVHDQALPGRALLRPARPDETVRRRRARRHRALRGVHAARPSRRGGWCSSAAAPGWRRSSACCARWPRRRRAPGVYYYGARTETDLFHREELEALARGVPVLPLRPRAVGGRPRRRLGRRDGPDHRRRRAPARRTSTTSTPTVCGPPPMVEAAHRRC